MDAADILCKSLFRWLENRRECAGKLEKLAQELEDHQRSNTTQGGEAGTSVRSISVGAAFISGMARLASDSTAKNEDFSSSTFDKATELIKEDEKAGTSIQKQLQDLKDRCAEASLRDHADKLDCEVTTLLMPALARSHMTPGGPAAAEASDFICQALRLDRFPEITSSLKVSAKEMMKNIELIGIKAKAGSEGTIGLGISMYDLIVTSEELANRSGVTEASKFLRDSAREILDGQLKLKEQLDAMHEIIHKLFIMKSLIKDLGEYSLSMTKKVQRIMDYIMETCRDNRVLSWLQGKPHQIEFVNLLRFFKERFSPIPEDLSTASGGHIHIVFVAHGGIVDRFMPAGVLVPTPNIRDTILYSPWNCRIDANAAFAIAQGNIHASDRAFFNIAHCQPIPLPDHWNSMRRSQESGHKIPEIRLSPVTPEDGAWRRFYQLMVNRGLEIEGRVIIPYLVPKDQVEAYGEIPLYMFIFLTSFLLKLSNKSATVHLAACLSRIQLVRQYAYTSDRMSMTVRIDDQDKNSELFKALRSLFDTTNTGLESDPEQFNA